MERIYTEDFPQADQQQLEKEFEQILQQRDMGGIDIATKIVTKLFRHWKADNPGFIALFSHVVNAYLYDIEHQPYMRPGINAADLLLFVMQSAYPQFVKQGVPHEHPA